VGVVTGPTWLGDDDDDLATGRTPRADDELDKLTPWQWVKAVGGITVSTLWCLGWLVWDLFVADFTGWWHALFVSIFALLLAFNLWQWPRSLRSYRRLVTSTRRLGETRARFLKKALTAGYPPEIVLRVDQMILSDAPPGDVMAVLAEHRPPRRRWLFGPN
jgi:hypothetical protein